MNCHVPPVGKPLPKERWMDAAESLNRIAPSIASIIRKVNGGGRGEQDAYAFMDNIALAYMALRFVAENATDKCRFVILPDKKEGGPENEPNKN